MYAYEWHNNIIMKIMESDYVRKLLSGCWHSDSLSEDCYTQCNSSKSTTSYSSCVVSPVVTLSVSDCKLLPDRNEFGGDGLTVAEQV